MNDTEIIALYWARKEVAIEATEQKYGAYCRSIARNILHDVRDEQESLNDTWLAAWNSMPPQRPTLLQVYLGKLTRRISLKKWRSKRAQKRGGGEIGAALDELSECIPSGDSVEKALEDAALAKLIDHFIEGLPDIERRVFICRYWYLESIREVAQRFGFSQSKVKSMLHRCRMKLKKPLTEEGVFE